MQKKSRDVLIIIIAVIALCVPFANKAYHIDDVAFLYIADQIEKDPLRPYSFMIEWGQTIKPAAKLLDTPLVPYYMALITVIFGRSEIALHLAFVLFPILAGISFYFVARKFVTFPLFSTLLLLSSPIFLPNAHNLMLDVPSLSFFLLSIALFVYGVDSKNNILCASGGIAAGIAFLAKPQSLVVVPILLAYCIMKEKWKYAVYPFIAFVFVAMFSVHNVFFEEYVIIKDYVPFLSGAKQSSILVFGAYVMSNVTAIGGAAIFPLLLFYPFLREKKNWCLFLVAAIFGTVVAFGVSVFSGEIGGNHYNFFYAFLLFFFSTGAMFFMIVVLKEYFAPLKRFLMRMVGQKTCNEDDGRRVFILAWLMGTFLINCVISGGAVRHIVYFLPAMLLCYVDVVSKYVNMFKINIFRFVTVSVGTTLILGVFVAVADYQLAEVYRDFSKNGVKEVVKNGQSLHFLGGAGFQYYMEEEGYRMMSREDNLPRQGDVVVKAKLMFPRSMSDDLTKRSQLESIISYENPSPLRVQNEMAHAGYYTYGGGLLPYSLGTAPLEEFEIYSVVR